MSAFGAYCICSAMLLFTFSLATNLLVAAAAVSQIRHYQTSRELPPLTPQLREVIVGCALGDLYIRRDSSNARLEFKQGLINERIYDTFLLSLRYIVALLQGFQVRILKRREKATLQFALRLYHLLSLMSFINSFIRMGVRSYLKPSALFLHPGPLRTFWAMLRVWTGPSVFCTVLYTVYTVYNTVQNTLHTP